MGRLARPSINSYFEEKIFEGDMMVKAKISFKGYRRTFYTRKDWKNGKKLYMRYPREKRMSGNWYNDPGYDYMAWDDYYREYDRQQRGEKPELPKGVKEMIKLVQENNDIVLEKILNGESEINLEELIKVI